MPVFSIIETESLLISLLSKNPLTDSQRGLIFHGLPGNGKTISIKALLHKLSQRDPPIPTLYVKSTGRDADSDDIRNIFKKARENAPCLLVLEDIDSLVKDNLKSFFLNEIDGLEGNDGIMIIGSTNYRKPTFSGSLAPDRNVCHKFHPENRVNQQRKFGSSTWDERRMQNSRESYSNHTFQERVILTC